MFSGGKRVPMQVRTPVYARRYRGTCCIGLTVVRLHGNVISCYSIAM